MFEMRNRYAILVALICMGLLSGCVLTSVNRTGERFPSYDRDCTIDYRYGDMMKGLALVSSGYSQVGTITVAYGGDTFTEAMKANVGPRACAIGGDVVMMAASAEGSASSGASYATLMVFRRISAPSKNAASTTSEL
jgi:hypothetical protein